MALEIAILLYDNFTALDVVGPYEVLSRIPESKILMVASSAGMYKNDRGLKILAEYSIDDVPQPQILIIPGGPGIDAILNDEKILQWIRRAHETSKWTVSVCSGSLLLASAGIVNDRKVTTHWNRKKQLATYQVIVVNERYVLDGKIISSAGVSAGIDMSLYLLSLIVSENFAKAVQLGIEYDPQPPFDSGLPEKAPREILNSVTQRISNK